MAKLADLQAAVAGVSAGVDALGVSQAAAFARLEAKAGGVPEADLDAVVADLASLQDRVKALQDKADAEGV